MKTKIIVMLLIMTASVLAVPPIDYVPGELRVVDNETYINANKILMFSTNHGSFGSDIENIFGNYYGTYYPYVSIPDIESGLHDNGVLYAAGLWMGGVDSATGEIRVAIAEYEDEYVPGPMANGTYQTDRPEFRVYKLYKDSLGNNPNADYLQWPVDQGAPIDEFGNPKMLGDQMLWTVFNDANPNQHYNNAGITEPLGVEVQQTVWATNTASFDEAIYIKYKIYNKGSNSINGFYLSLWSDPDLGQFTDDLVGCDTLNNIFYCYNGDNDDNQYGAEPPAIGFKVLKGPVVPSYGDVADFDGNLVPNYKNLGLTAFNKYINGTDPDDFQETYNYMQGLNKDGSPLPNGTKYAVPGNPVTGSGDLDFDPSDRRMMGSFGPMDFRPGDSQYVLIKMAVGQGLNRLSSITVLKNILNFEPPVLTELMTAIKPNPQYGIFLFAHTPIMDTVFITREGSDEIGEVDFSSLLINGSIVPETVTLLPSHAGFFGEVLALVFPATDFIMYYGQPWGINNVTFTVTGTFTNMTPLLLEGETTIIGHREGDVNVDGAVNVSDAVYIINYLFRGGQEPEVSCLADINCDGSINVEDAVALVNFFFKGGPAPQRGCCR